MVFFDVGGTLAERGDDEVAETLAALAELGAGGSREELAAALSALRHAYRSGVYAPSTLRGERRLWRALAAICLRRLPAGPRPRLVDGLSRSFAAYPRHYRPVPATAAVLAELRRAGRPVGIISNWPPSLPRFLEAVGLGRFAVVACSGALRCAKPDAAIFRWALRRAGVAPADAWHVGNDAAADYAPAAALGMRPVLWDPLGNARGRGLVRAGSAAELRTVLGLPAGEPAGP